MSRHNSGEMSPNWTPEEIRELVKEIQRAFNADRAKTAAMLGVTLRTLQRLENGETRPTQPRTLKLDAIHTLIRNLNGQ